MASVCINDDYAALDFATGSFYYGYEVSQCKACGNLSKHEFECDKCGHEELEWCFQATVADKKVTFAASELGLKDQFAEGCGHALLIGIGKFMEDMNNG